jgi:hypothetical protein
MEEILCGLFSFIETIQGFNIDAAIANAETTAKRGVSKDSPDSGDISSKKDSSPSVVTSDTKNGIHYDEYESKYKELKGLFEEIYINIEGICNRYYKKNEVTTGDEINVFAETESDSKLDLSERSVDKSSLPSKSTDIFTDIKIYTELIDEINKPPLQPENIINTNLNKSTQGIQTYMFGITQINADTSLSTGVSERRSFIDKKDYINGFLNTLFNEHTINYVEEIRNICSAAKEEIKKLKHTISNVKGESK